MKFHSEPALAFTTLFLTIALIGTRSVSMSDMVQTMMLGVFVAVIFAYTGLIYREKPTDEREYELSLMAGKHAYLVGGAVLTVGVVAQSLNHDLDIWLPLTLGSMVFVKTLSYFLNGR